MAADPVFFRDLAYVFLAALLGGGVPWLARQPLVLGYVMGPGTAALSQALGLSLALGAFLAGLVISESDHSHETLARLLPLRDAFVALFFVTSGPSSTRARCSTTS